MQQWTGYLTVSITALLQLLTLQVAIDQKQTSHLNDYCFTSKESGP